MDIAVRGKKQKKLEKIEKKLILEKGQPKTIKKALNDIVYLILMKEKVTGFKYILRA